jgi:DNA primase
MTFADYLDIHFDYKDVSGGRQWMLGGPCPFCGEDRADIRLYVNPETGLGDCKHCGKGFNGPQFVAAHEGCSIAKAIKILLGEEDGFVASEDEKIEKAPELIFPPMVRAVESGKAMGYLEGRGIDKALVCHFGLGFAVGNVEIDGRLFYAKNRVIIPVRDMGGKPVSWQGRDITGKSKMKYLFPPGFKGGEYLYNAYTVKPGQSYLILSEGVMDVFGWWRSGLKNVVATFGKHLSEAQLDIVRYLNPEVLFVAWDSDAHWNKYELIEKVGHYFKNIRLVDLNNKDADEKNRRQLLAALSNSKTYSWEDKILSCV